MRAALFAFAALLLVAAIVLIVVLRQADRALTNQAERTVPARVAASELLTSLVDQETGLRGFALTGDEQFLAPYRQGIINEQTARAQLEHLVPAGDPSRLALLTEDAAITAWRDQYASLRTAGATPGGTDATIRFGQQLFQRVRDTSAALDRQLGQQAAAAQDEADRDRRIVIVVLAIMVATVAAAVAALQRALKAMVLRPMSRLGSQVAVVATGDHSAAIEPDGPPDLREMGASVEAMRLELVRALGEVEVQRRGLERRASELARSNADLEQFAYVASHDLQEPLRKVASFCQLLEQRYGGQLDERADQYIAFAVDGAKRMQLLINDLLAFSRVGRTSEGFVPLALDTLITNAWQGLDVHVQQTNARLELDLDSVAQVRGDAPLLEVLLTNLFSNSLKYHRDDRDPVVRVSARVENGVARIDVADNGIGIPEEYTEKVFVIFQRLHGRDEYGGTGIGLALAKKIVEFHGGTIGLRPPSLGGACFSFTLPLEEERVDE